MAMFIYEGSIIWGYIFKAFPHDIAIVSGTASKKNAPSRRLEGGEMAQDC